MSEYNRFTRFDKEVENIKSIPGVNQTGLDDLANRMRQTDSSELGDLYMFVCASNINGTLNILFNFWNF